MKTPALVLTLSLASLLLSGCGEYNKNPVDDLDQMREQGKKQANSPQQQPQVITETVVVERPVEVIKEQTTINESFIVITADPQINFTEGQSSTFEIRGRGLNGIGVKLEAQNLPAGATFQAAPNGQDKDRYTLTWNPSFNTVASNTSFKMHTMKVVAKVTEVPANLDRKKVEALNVQKELNLLILKNQTPPTDLAVSLPAVVKENTVTNFDVTVKVLGVDNNSSSKPTLVVRYDGVSSSQGNNYLELDGSRHVLVKQDAQYIGDYKWKYSLAFDTKSISVQTPQSAKGTALTEATTANVRLSFKVYGPTGNSTPEQLKKVQITLDKPATVTPPAATPAPTATPASTGAAK